MDVASLLLLAIKTSILLTVFSIGLNASWQDALSLFRNPWLLIRSVLSMNVIMPLVAAGLVVVFDLPASVKIALVALAISPVPPILPKKELKAGGHASYAVGLLVAIALLAIVTVPVTMTWFAHAFDRTANIEPFAVAMTVAIAAGAESKPELAAIPLYLIVALLVCIPYVAWRRRRSMAAQT